MSILLVFFAIASLCSGKRLPNGIDHQSVDFMQTVGRLVAKSHLLPAIIVLGISTAQASEDITTFTAVPDRCISLHKGQVCYQHTTLRWTSATAANYCLFQQGADQPLQCWENATHGESTLDFQSSIPLTYHLFREGEKAPVASSTVSVAWVYKTPKRPRGGWRLF